MSEMFDENNMRQTLEPYIPSGETLLAGIHAVSQSTEIHAIFGRCVYTARGLRPDENAGTILLHKKKHTAYDVYLGITQTSLLIVECEENAYSYAAEDLPDSSGLPVRALAAPLPLDAVGTCFPLDEIVHCEIKNGWMGSVKCAITMKNGSAFQLLLPKRGGLGGGMPHHAEHRAAILARLGGQNG